LNEAKNRYEPYFYFAHRRKTPKGKWTVEWCYLGKKPGFEPRKVEVEVAEKLGILDKIKMIFRGG